MTSQKKNNLEIKKALYNLCQDYVDNCGKTIQNSIEEIQESLTSETKSTAGDKHETGRAMLQLEREKIGHQLTEIEKLKESLSKIDVNKASEIISLGSLVYTSKANYFISISAGQMDIGNLKFYAISKDTPIALQLIGRTLGSLVVFRDQKFKIVKVT